jgi:hypothetical protein
LARVWENYIQSNKIILTQQIWQKKGTQYVQLLNNLRENNINNIFWNYTKAWRPCS